jgi:excisionase family DNA binding protein
MEKLLFITTRDELKQILLEILREKDFISAPSIEKDRLTRTQAAKLAGVSLPTFAKMVKAGKFPEHGFGTRNKFYFRSEIVEALKKEADNKNVLSSY